MTSRNMLDGFQDMYFLRRDGIIAEHHWRQWTAALVFSSSAVDDALLL
jgi:hypothetical protein